MQFTVCGQNFRSDWQWLSDDFEGKGWREKGKEYIESSERGGPQIENRKPCKSAKRRGAWFVTTGTLEVSHFGDDRRGLSDGFKREN